MSEPIAVCIEMLDTADPAERFVRCVAVPGGTPGLALAGNGVVLWEAARPSGCELCVSVDGRLLLWRPAEAEPVLVSRAGRSLKVPFEKPVVLLDQDEVDVGARRMRLHVHGPAAAVHPPAPLRARVRSATATLAAAMALGTAATGCDELGLGGKDEIEVRDLPPTVAPEPPEDAAAPDAAATATNSTTSSAQAAPDASASGATTSTTRGPPIEVRAAPPTVVPPERKPPTKPAK
jgi:hypothetical protein